MQSEAQRRIRMRLLHVRCHSSPLADRGPESGNGAALAGWDRERSAARRARRMAYRQIPHFQVQPLHPGSMK
jgi:hypothetical protein